MTPAQITFGTGDEVHGSSPRTRWTCIRPAPAAIRDGVGKFALGRTTVSERIWVSWPEFPPSFPALLGSLEGPDHIPEPHGRMAQTPVMRPRLRRGSDGQFALSKTNVGKRVWVSRPAFQRLGPPFAFLVESAFAFNGSLRHFCCNEPRNFSDVWIAS